jgi:hypothetical protein
MQPSYRNWLQSLANGGGLPSQEANALLRVTGDDFKVDQNFLADPYAYTGNERGQINVNAWDSPDQNFWYGPQGVSSLNEIYSQKYRDKFATPTSSALTGGGGGGGASAQQRALNQAGIDATNMSIEQQKALLADLLAQESTKFQNIQNQFSQQEAAEQGRFDEGITQNQLNYDRNLMSAVRAGSKGLRGLMGALRGLGASGGTGEDMVRNAVQETTARDIRTGADTQMENQGALKTALQNFMTRLGGQKKEAEDTFENNQRAVKRENASQLQNLYKTMSGYYADVEDTPNAVSWMNKASELTPEIAQNMRSQVTPYSFEPVKVEAPTLTAFSGPAQQNVGVNPGTNAGEVGSGIFTIGDRRRRAMTGA